MQKSFKKEINPTWEQKTKRYRVSVLVEIPDNQIANNSKDGIGIDLGLKDFAVVSNGKTYKNINKQQKLRNWKNSCAENRDVSPASMKM